MAKRKMIEIPMSDILPEFRKAAIAWAGKEGTPYMHIWDKVKLASDFQNAAILELEKLNKVYGKNKSRKK